jgi:PII-like signaling protein
MAIIEMLRREGFRGATAIRGVAGFGASTLIHTAAILRLSLDQPLVITVVDRPARIERVLESLREMAPHALIVVQDLEVAQSGAPFKEGLPDIKVSEVMRREVATVHPQSPITEVVELLLEKGYTAVPVVDNEGKVVGMVSDNDLLKRGGMRVTISLKKATRSRLCSWTSQVSGKPKPDRVRSNVDGRRNNPARHDPRASSASDGRKTSQTAAGG